MRDIAFISVSKTFKDRQVLSDVTLRVEPGMRLVVFGPSGCGKTTLLRLLAGFIAPESGSIHLGGEIVSEDHRILVPPEKRRLGMVFQDLALWPHLTVRGNLEFGLKAQNVPPTERHTQLSEILESVRLEAYANIKPAQLSGGEQQRVALARALVLRPDTLLMDEPLSSLDEQLSVQLRREILRLHSELKFTLLYVTHNHEEASDIATHLVHMRDGILGPVEPV